MIDQYDTAQLQLGPEVSLFGKLLYVDEGRARLRPLNHDSSVSQFYHGCGGYLLFFRGSRLISAPTSIEAIPGGDLALTFCGAPSTLERRYAERVSCSLEVNYRSYRTTNTFSAWNSGGAMNLSATGVGFWIAKEPPASRILDVRISIPAVPFDPEVEALFNGNSSADLSRRTARVRTPAFAAKREERLASPEAGRPIIMKLPPIRARGQIRHMRQSTEGVYYIGLRFTTMTPTLFWQLTWVVENIRRGSAPHMPHPAPVSAPAH
jgi:hypothetical protein